jgi:hypothetical protein
MAAQASRPLNWLARRARPLPLFGIVFTISGRVQQI